MKKLLSAAWLFTDDEGRILFFPWGIMGHCVELPSEVEADRFRRAYLISVLVMILFVVPLFFLDLQIFFWLAILGWTVGWIWWTRGVLKDLPQPDVRVTYIQGATKFAKHLPRYLLFFGLLAGLLFVAFSGVLFAAVPSQWPILTASLIFGITATGAYGWLLYLRARS